MLTFLHFTPVWCSSNYELLSRLVYLKEHGQLVHMCIRYHFIANLHITLHHKTRERRTETEKRINKPCRIEVFANQSSGYMHVTLLEH